MIEIKSGFKKTKLGWVPKEWKVQKFSDTAEVIMGQSPDGKSYNNVGEGIALINGPTEFTERFPIKKQWTSQPTKLCNKGDILLCVRGSSTGRINISNDIYCIGRGVAAIRANGSNNHTFIEYQLRNAVDRILKLTTGSTFPNIDSKSLKGIIVGIPPFSEQKKIATVLSTWDKAIEKMGQLIEVKEEQKKGLMQRLLTGKVRVKGFNNDWKEKKLGEIFKERKERGRKNLELLSIGAEGVYPQSNSNKKDNSNSDKSKYKRICPGDIGYNTMRMWQGRSAVSQLEGIVSPAYTIVTPKENIDVNCMGYLFQLPKTIHTFLQYSQGLVSDTLNCKFPSFAKIKVVIPPSKEEQEKIANIIQIAGQEIQTIKDKRDLFIEQKKGLMQRLLTGKIRVL